MFFRYFNRFNRLYFIDLNYYNYSAIYFNFYYSVDNLNLHYHFVSANLIVDFSDFLLTDFIQVSASYKSLRLVAHLHARSLVNIYLNFRKTFHHVIKNVDIIHTTDHINARLRANYTIYQANHK